MQEDAAAMSDSADEQDARQHASAVLVSGPVGSGKSALVYAAAKVCIWPVKCQHNLSPEMENFGSNITNNNP